MYPPTKTNEANFSQVTFCPQHPVQKRQPCHQLTLEVDLYNHLLRWSQTSHILHIECIIDSYTIFKDDQRSCVVSFKNLFSLQVHILPPLLCGPYL